MVSAPRREYLFGLLRNELKIKTVGARLRAIQDLVLDEVGTAPRRDFYHRRYPKHSLHSRGRLGRFSRPKVSCISQEPDVELKIFLQVVTPKLARALIKPAGKRTREITGIGKANS